MKIVDTLKVIVIVDEMKRNSEAWMTATKEERKKLALANQDLGEHLRVNYGVPAVYDPKAGVWYYGDLGGPLLYDVY